MTPDERRARLQVILDRHDDVARAFQRSRDDIAAAQDGLEQIGREVRDLAHAIGEAAAGMIAANRAALALFNEAEEEHRS